jgi:hypothetical protein
MTSAPYPSANTAPPTPAEWGMPTRWGGVLFGIKRALYQARRALRDLGAGPQFLAKSKDAGFLVTLGTSRTPLWSDDRQEERAYQLGKVQNLRRAAADLDGS